MATFLYVFTNKAGEPTTPIFIYKNRIDPFYRSILFL